MKNHFDDMSEAAMAFESEHYGNATPETRRLLFHARPTIKRFLDSDLGLARPR